MYACGSARFFKVQEEGSGFYLVINLPGTLTNFSYEKNPDHAL